MENEILIQGEAIDALLTGVLAAEYFLNKHYLFRRNVLNGKVEFSIRPAEGEEPAFRVLTIQAQNSIILQAKREDIYCGDNPKPDILEYINSEEVETFDPATTTLESRSLPRISTTVWLRCRGIR